MNTNNSQSLAQTWSAQPQDKKIDMGQQLKKEHAHGMSHQGRRQSKIVNPKGC